MDTMRAVLMMLGVVLHSSQVFSAEHTWVIYSDNTIRFAGWLVSLVVHVVAGLGLVFGVDRAGNPDDPRGHDRRR